MSTETQSDQQQAKAKKQAIALLFTHESADRFNPKNDCSPYREFDIYDVKEVVQIQTNKDVDVVRLNGNQTEKGLQAFSDTYEEIVLVLAYPEDKTGEMRVAADKLIQQKQKVHIVSPKQIMQVAKKMNFAHTVI